ncbi:hypothetical protein BaRGS_00034212 [Batillaria attramentaria]|uniref:Uncharacterized protein n=1 Tax=Batillaria attramentaria TaxID=370345 RepID=A0ABD0JHZ8_9CAEN
MILTQPRSRGTCSENDVRVQMLAACQSSEHDCPAKKGILHPSGRFKFKALQTSSCVHTVSQTFSFCAIINTENLPSPKSKQSVVMAGKTRVS